MDGIKAFPEDIAKVKEEGTKELFHRAQEELLCSFHSLLNAEIPEIV